MQICATIYPVLILFCCDVFAVILSLHNVTTETHHCSVWIISSQFTARN